MIHFPNLRHLSQVIVLQHSTLTAEVEKMMRYPQEMKKQVEFHIDEVETLRQCSQVRYILGCISHRCAEDHDAIAISGVEIKAHWPQVR